METNNIESTQMPVQHPWHKSVQTFRYFLMFLVIVLPFLGFWLGVQYASVQKEQVVEIEQKREESTVNEITSVDAMSNMRSDFLINLGRRFEIKEVKPSEEQQIAMADIAMQLYDNNSNNVVCSSLEKLPVLYREKVEKLILDYQSTSTQIEVRETCLVSNYTRTFSTGGDNYYGRILDDYSLAVHIAKFPLHLDVNLSVRLWSEEKLLVIPLDLTDNYLQVYDLKFENDTATKKIIYADRDKIYFSAKDYMFDACDDFVECSAEVIKVHEEQRALKNGEKPFQVYSLDRVTGVIEKTRI